MRDLLQTNEKADELFPSAVCCVSIIEEPPQPLYKMQGKPAKHVVEIVREFFRLHGDHPHQRYELGRFLL